MSDSGPRVLVVDDEPAIRRFLQIVLVAHDYVVSEAEDGKQAIALVYAEHPDLLVLDLGLPDIDGIEVTRLLREWNQLPIIILSVRGSDQDKIAALDAGADDYLTKPFSSGELLARLRAAQRRAAKNMPDPIFVVGALKIDLARRLVTLHEHEVQLTPTEYDILRLLVKDAGKVLTHGQILRSVWGLDYNDMHTLRVNISNLRKKIEPDDNRPHYVLTEAGVGYRLRTDD